MTFAFTKRSSSIIRGFAGVLAALVILVACAKDDTEYQERTVEQLYNSIDTLSDVVRDQSDRGLIATPVSYTHLTLPTKA